MSNLVHLHEVAELSVDNSEEGASARLAFTILLSALVSVSLGYKWAGLVSEQSLCSTTYGCLIILYLLLSHWEQRRGNLRSVSTITAFQRQTRIIPASSCFMGESEQVTWSCSCCRRCNMSQPSGKHPWGLGSSTCLARALPLKCAHGERTPWKGDPRWLSLLSNYSDEASACQEIHKWKTDNIDSFQEPIVRIGQWPIKNH